MVVGILVPKPNDKKINLTVGLDELQAARGEVRLSMHTSMLMMTGDDTPSLTE